MGGGLAIHHVLGDSATADEPVHIASAVEIAREGTGRWNVEHPPLAKALAGVSLTGLPVRSAGDPFVEPAHARVLYRFLFENETSGERILLRARLPFIALYLVLLLALRREARARFGPEAGLAAVALGALEPNLIAHAGVVHTDVAVTLFVVLSLRPLARIGDAEARRTTWWLGLLWGLAFLSKYSAPLLVLATLPLLLAESRPRLRFVVPRLALAGGTALLVTLAGFALAYRHQSPADRDALARDRLLVRGQSEAAYRAAAAAGRVLAPAGNLATGVLSVALQSRIGAGVNYFRGRVSDSGSALYFPAALAVKTPLALAGAALLGGLVLGGRRLALALAASLAVLLLLTARSTYNIGVRHVLIAYPFAILAASAAAASRARGTRTVLALLVALEGVATLSSHPHELSFFNLAGGGLQGGRRWFVDSNLDWGQDLARLAKAAPAYAHEPIPAVVFGGDLPRRYPTLRAVAPGDEERPGAVIAIGEQPLAVGPELLRSKGAPHDAERLESVRRAIATRGERIGEIGGSIGIWRLR